MAMLTAVAEVTMAPVAVRVVAWLVAVSVFTSMVASYAAFIFAERITTSRGGARVLWLVSGAMAMGLGIWSMHYLGMLAVRLPVDQDAPALMSREVEVINLESDSVFGVLNAGPQVLDRQAVFRTAEVDRAVVKLVVHRQHGEVVTARVGDPPDAAGRDQPQALSFA